VAEDDDRLPQQARSLETLSRLLDATESLLSEGGVDAATVPAIAAKAGVSIGAVYRRFVDKDALLHAACQRFLERADARAAMTIAHAKNLAAFPPAALVRQMIAGIIFGYHLHGGIIRAIYQLADEQPDSAFRRFLDARQVRIVAQALDVLKPCLPHIRHPHPELAIRTAILVVGWTMQKKLMLAPRKLPGPTGVSEEALEEELSRMVLTYLGFG